MWKITNIFNVFFNTEVSKSSITNISGDTNGMTNLMVGLQSVSHEYFGCYKRNEKFNGGVGFPIF